MTATVRTFTYAGMISLPVSSFSSSRADNAVWVPREPYLASETLSITSGSATATAAPLAASEHVKFVKVEVQTGKRVRYECTPYGHDARTATTDSPALVGTEFVMFGPNWTLSFIEDA